MSQVAKIFTNGRSQAVRLPVAFRFDAKEVFIRQDPVTHDVILSRKPATWDGFFDVVRGDNLANTANASTDIPADFLNAKERAQGTASRDPFEGWQE